MFSPNLQNYVYRTPNTCIKLKQESVSVDAPQAVIGRCTVPPADQTQNCRFKLFWLINSFCLSTELFVKIIYIILFGQEDLSGKHISLGVL